MRKVLFIIGARKLSSEMQETTGAEFPAQLYASNTNPLQVAIVKSFLNGTDDDVEVYSLCVDPEDRTEIDMKAEINFDVVQHPRLLKWRKVFLRQESESLYWTYRHLATFAKQEEFEADTQIFVQDADVLIRKKAIFQDVQPGTHRALVLKLSEATLLTAGSQFTLLTTHASQDSPNWQVLDRRAGYNQKIPASTEVLAYAGVIGFTDVISLEKTLNSYSVMPPQTDLRSQFRRLLNDTSFLHHLLKDCSAEIIPESEFFDYGHIDAYYRSRLLGVSSRDFHTVSVNLERGTVSKKATSGSSLYNQILWFRNISRSITPWLPTIFKAYTGFKEQDEPELVMDLLPYSSLADHLLQRTLTSEGWCSVGLKLNHMLWDLLHLDYEQKLKYIGGIIDSRRIYMDKTRTRVQSFLDSVRESDNPEFWGSIPDSLRAVLYMLEGYIESRSLGVTRRPALVHGDLCFSNILFDRRSTKLKIIDPRGSFFAFEDYKNIRATFLQNMSGNSAHSYLVNCVGDPAYEYAKLFHSLSGYDLILAGRYKLEWNERKDPTVVFFQEDMEYVNVIKQSFARTVFSENHKTNRDISRGRDIEPLLFLSMLPLHSDDKYRQRALATLGIQLFDRRHRCLG